MRRLVAVLTIVAGALAAGCSGGSGDADADADAEADAQARADAEVAALGGTLRRATLFDTQRAFSLTLEPSGDRDLRVGTIQLRSPLFEEVPAQRRDTIVRATERAVVMPLRYGEVQCDAAADGPAELAAEVDGDEVRLPLDEVPERLLVELHAAECEVADVLAAVDVRFSDRWERVGPRAVETDLELVQRRAGVEAAVVELEGNVIFTVEPGEPGLAVGDGRSSDRARVVVEASRCDPHALIEYKRKFILRVRVRVGDDDPVAVDVRAVGPGQRALEGLLAACLG